MAYEDPAGVEAGEATPEHTLADESAIAEAGFLGRMIQKGGVFIASLFLISAAFIMYEIFMRYVLNAPTLWTNESTIFICGVSFIYGGLYCVARDRHIRVVLVYDHLPDRWRRVFDVVISIMCFISACFFAWASWTMVEKSWWAPGGALRLEGTGSAWNPPTPALAKGFLMVVMIVMAVQFLVLAVNYLRKGR
ncbi:TRAP transporter small permease subunit [Pararhizobium mangrovi]|uniref:TRAP transporter small permease protein n=1 Tax=Pararhizobium mangrovi TaxID=2590452 RepID=A0A506UHZ1_9HYPH|nr:TRAP transporter small permease [Pararhizobium mangrovi]TPW32944.1 TRAP transporter small permease [Pararhizobium mangrovi]